MDSWIIPRIASNGSLMHPIHNFLSANSTCQRCPAVETNYCKIIRFDLFARFQASGRIQRRNWMNGTLGLLSWSGNVGYQANENTPFEAFTIHYRHHHLVYHRPHQVSNKKKTTPFLFKDDDDCGDFHSAAKTTEIWIVYSGKLFLSPFSLFWLPLASGNADTQQALENWPGDKNVVFFNLFKCALIPFPPLIAPFSRTCMSIIKKFGLYFLFKTIKPVRL